LILKDLKQRVSLFPDAKKITSTIGPTYLTADGIFVLHPCRRTSPRLYKIFTTFVQCYGFDAFDQLVSRIEPFVARTRWMR